MRVLGILVGLGGMALVIWYFGVKIIGGCIKERYLANIYKHDLKTKVSWIATKEHRYDDLDTFIAEAQYELKIEGKSQIDFSTEKDYICDILEIHKQEVIESYFRDALNTGKNIYRLDSLEYYMWSLWKFLERDLNCSFRLNLLGEDMYNRLPDDGNSTTYVFSQNGAAYLKLYYVVSLFCVNNDNIKHFFTTQIHLTIKKIEKILEDGEVIVTK